MHIYYNTYYIVTWLTQRIGNCSFWFCAQHFMCFRDYLIILNNHIKPVQLCGNGLKEFVHHEGSLVLRSGTLLRELSPWHLTMLHFSCHVWAPGEPPASAACFISHYMLTTWLGENADSVAHGKWLFLKETLLSRDLEQTDSWLTESSLPLN